MHTYIVPRFHYMYMEEDYSPSRNALLHLLSLGTIHNNMHTENRLPVENAKMSKSKPTPTLASAEATALTPFC